MSFFSNLFGAQPSANLGQVISDGAFLVDVRTPGEFAEGHVKGSVNIPLDTIPARLADFKDKKHVIVFCRSGNRSGQAKTFLETNGISNVINGGTWTDVNQFVQ
jgi:rhodanese-related sulfurtransferase